MDRLDQLESNSIHIFREAFNQLNKPGMLWSLGKDSNVMIWLGKKAFFGNVPFPVIHLDTGAEFPETYAFRDRYDLALLISNDSDLTEPIKQVRLELNKRVIVASPEGSVLRELREAAGESREIRATVPAKCQLPDQLDVGSGRQVKRPRTWGGAPA